MPQSLDHVLICLLNVSAFMFVHYSGRGYVMTRSGSVWHGNFLVTFVVHHWSFAVLSSKDFSLKLHISCRCKMLL